MIAKKMIRAVGVVLALAAFCVPQSYATVPTCPEESLLGHPASTASNNSALDAAASDLWPWPAPGYSDDPTVAFKSYTDAEPVCKVRWWGISGVYHFHPFGRWWDECTKPDEGFDIRFYADSAGEPAYPGTAAHDYPNVSFTKVDTGYVLTYNSDGGGFQSFSLYEYEAELPSCCPLLNGWISIQGHSTGGGTAYDTACLFLWAKTAAGNGDSMQYVPYTFSPDMFELEYNLSACLMGISRGACCDDDTGFCTNGVAPDACEPPRRFSPDVTCAELEPPCGDFVGACCFRDGWCDAMTHYSCDAAVGDYQGDFTDCGPPNPCPQPPANDSCENAEPVGDVGDLRFDTTMAGSNGDPGSCVDGPNIWYCYTASCTGVVTAGLCGSSFHTALAIYADCVCGPDGGELMGCRDDYDCNPNGSPDYQGRVAFRAEAGREYLIEVGGAAGAVGEGVLSISCEPSGACCGSFGCKVLTELECIGTNGTYAGDGSTCREGDCNSNGTMDVCEIAECEGDPACGDCNHNGIPDECDIASGTSRDCQRNGIPDECDGGCGGGAPLPECTEDADCDDGLFCNGAETCASGACEGGDNPCADDETCDEAGDVCIAPTPLECTTDADCDDGLFCNGAETCVDGACEGGAGPCAEDETCDEADDVCVAPEPPAPEPLPEPEPQPEPDNGGIIAPEPEPQPLPDPRRVGCGIYNGVAVVLLPFSLFLWTGLRGRARRRALDTLGVKGRL